jgi:hypothetical protein
MAILHSDNAINARLNYKAVMRRVVLPPRGKQGSKANERRRWIVMAALHQNHYKDRTRCPIAQVRGKCKLCRIKVTYAKSSATP